MDTGEKQLTDFFAEQLRVAAKKGREDPSTEPSNEEPATVAVLAAAGALDLPTQQLTPSQTDFIKVEKNLASLGFFSPGTKRIKSEKSKTISFTKVIDGDKVEAKATIVPAALYGLPITADQDKYLALQKIITDILLQDGRVENPVAFSSSQLLRMLGQNDSGKNFRDVKEWLDVMFSTSIISEGTVYLAGRKQWVKATDRFRVFDRAVTVGGELEPGTVADRNYVWLSEWQLENLNNAHVLPVDFEAYKQLRNHISKALVPLLQIWLYASRSEGSFEKRYDQICEILNIRKYDSPSLIKRNFGRAMDELKVEGYLSDWKLEPLPVKGSGYKIVFHHGEKFYRDHRKRVGKRSDAAKALSPGAPRRDRPVVEAGKAPVGPSNADLLVELTKRGISESQAKGLLQKLPADHQLLKLLEWGDYQVNQAPESFRNPPGFYISLIRQNASPPEGFSASSLAVAADDASAGNTADQKAAAAAYEAYRAGEVTKAIAEMSPDGYEALVEEEKEALLTRFPVYNTCPEKLLRRLSEAQVRARLGEEIPLLSDEDFARSEEAGDSPPGTETTAAAT